MIPSEIDPGVNIDPAGENRICKNVSNNANLARSLGTPKITLETLPLDILNKILDHVLLLDLLNLCWLSKTLYWPAVSRIYRKLVYGSVASSSMARLVKDPLPRSYGTFITEGKLEILEGTLEKNDRLACLIDSVTIHSVEAGVLPTKLLFLAKNMTAYYGAVDRYRRYRPSLNTGQLRKLTCLASNVPQFTDRLVELTLSQPGTANEYRQIARNMVTLKSYLNLKGLHFTTRSHNYYPRMFDEDPLLRDVDDGWLSFFEVFQSAELRLQLSSLTIYCLFSGPAVKVARILDAVDLKNLRALTLEYPHICRWVSAGNRPSIEGVNLASFFKHITRRTSLLECLTVRSGAMWPANEIATICKTLENILPHQLKEFSIYQDDMREYGSPKLLKMLQNSIVSSQRRLVKLVVYQYCPHGFETADQVIPQLAKYKLRLHERFPLVPQTNRTRFEVYGWYKGHFNETKKGTKKALERDWIYSNAKVHLPDLEEYFFGGVLIDVKRGGIFANTGTILFELEGNIIDVGDETPSALERCKHV